MSEETEARARHARAGKAEETIKRHNKQHPDAALHLISVPCMDLCPKGAVAICLPAAQTAMLSILRKEGEIDELYRRG